jgi:hypothetical protein
VYILFSVAYDNLLRCKTKEENYFILYLKMPQVRRFAQIVHLKPSAVEAYKECHANVWPEVLRQIHDSNIRDCM